MDSGCDGQLSWRHRWSWCEHCGWLYGRLRRLSWPRQQVSSQSLCSLNSCISYYSTWLIAAHWSQILPVVSVSDLLSAADLDVGLSPLPVERPGTFYSTLFAIHHSAPASSDQLWPSVKDWVVGCWHGYLSGARCRLHMVQLMPLPLYS